jgi:hypothetical protein
MHCLLEVSVCENLVGSRGLRVGEKMRSVALFAIWLFVSVNGMGALQTSSPQNSDTGIDSTPRIAVNVRRVLIPVLVRDKQGAAIGDLKKEDFQVFDNGKLHDLSGFMIESFGYPGNAAVFENGNLPTPAAGVQIRLPQQRPIVSLYSFSTTFMQVLATSRTQRAARNS